MEEQIPYTRGDVAPLLIIPLYKLNYIIETICIKEERRLAGKRIYTEKAVNLIKRHLVKRNKKTLKKSAN